MLFPLWEPLQIRIALVDVLQSFIVGLKPHHHRLKRSTFTHAGILKHVDLNPQWSVWKLLPTLMVMALKTQRNLKLTNLQRMWLKQGFKNCTKYTVIMD